MMPQIMQADMSKLRRGQQGAEDPAAEGVGDP